MGCWASGSGTYSGWEEVGRHLLGNLAMAAGEIDGSGSGLV